MKCALCGCEFDEDTAAPACGHCPMSRSCTLVRCPKCGYESPVTPSWIRKLQHLFRRKGSKNETKQQS